jgi:uncharacterized protein (TIGR03083 family)
MPWGAEIADVLVQTSGLLESLTPEQWEGPSLCEGWRVRDVAGHIVWRLGTDSPQMARDLFQTARQRGIGFGWAIDTLSTQAAQAEPAELVRGIRSIARRKLAGEGRVGIGELTEAVVHSYDITGALHTPIEVEPRVTHAVAKMRVPLTTGDVRAVLGARTLRATDAGWQVGRGPVVEGTAQGVVLYVFGRSPLSAD